MKEYTKRVLQTLALGTICTGILEFLFIKNTINLPISNQTNPFTGIIYSRTESYILFAITMYLIMLVFWGFVCFADYNREIDFNGNTTKKA